MLKTVEAVIEKDGRIHLLEDVGLVRTTRVLVTFLDDNSGPRDVAETEALSEAALSRDWNRPEEDDAWRHLH